MNETILHQRQARRYGEFKDGKYVYLFKDDDARSAEFEKQQERLKTIEGIIENIQVS